MRHVPSGLDESGAPTDCGQRQPGRQQYRTFDVVCLTTALVAAFVCAPFWFAQIWPKRGANPADFFQEWSAARDTLDGRPAYSSFTESMPRLLGPTYQAKNLGFDINARTPAALLVGLPLGRLDYWSALRVWNLTGLALLVLSMVLVVRGLGLTATPR